jgi:hypothetical protein
MIPAIIVGLLTAWYLGVRAGVIAAGLAFAAIVAASIVPIPGITLAAYGVIIIWSAVMYFFGPRLSKSASSTQGLRNNPAINIAGNAASQVGSAVSWAKRTMKRVIGE